MMMPETRVASYACVCVAFSTATIVGQSHRHRHDDECNTIRHSKFTMAAPNQSIWIVRYGLTKYPLQENFGPYDSKL
jgi:hypothetical protein